ncbi:hypothetical protein EFW58_01689 [Bacillus velezensis]|nr:hypothetical protein EFW58_01689 [Bacillus velezensis]
MDTLPFFFYYITKLEKRNVFLSNYYRMKTVKSLHKRRILFRKSSV